GLVGLYESSLRVRNKPDPGVLGILGANAGQVVGDRRVQLCPMCAAVGGAENCSGVADNPTNSCGGSRAGEEIGVDAADLLDPIQALVLGMFEGTCGADAPELFSILRSEYARILQRSGTHQAEFLRFRLGQGSRGRRNFDGFRSR